MIQKTDQLYNDNIYFYEIIYGGNSSEIIENCLKRRNQWRVYQRSNDDYFFSYNNNNNNNANSPNNSTNNSSSIKYGAQTYVNLSNIYNNSSNPNSNENNPLPNFIWSHSSKRLDFSEFSKFRPAHIKKMTNHFEFHTEITNKMNLFLNMMTYCENFNLDLLSMLPLTFPISYESKNYINEIASFANIFNNINKYVDDKQSSHKYRNLFELELKGRTGYKTSLHIPKTHYCGRNLWLVKAIDLNRGRCIKISDNLSGIESIIKHFYKGMKRGFFKLVTKEEIDDDEKEDDNAKNKKGINIKINNNINNSNTKEQSKKSKIINKKFHLPSLVTSNNNNNNINEINDKNLVNKKEKNRNIKEKKEQISTNHKNTNSNIASYSMKGCQLLKYISKTIVL